MINSKTVLYYTDGQNAVKKTRVLGRNFNRLLRTRNGNPSFFDEKGTPIVPEKSWNETAATIRNKRG